MSKPHIKFDHSKPLFSGILSFTILLSMLWVLFSFKEFPCKPNDPLHPLDCLNLSWADFNTTIAVIGPAVTAQLALTIASFAPDETCNTAVREHLSRMRDTAGYIAFGLWGLQASLALICLLDATSNPERPAGPPLVIIFLLTLTLFLTVVIADTRGQKEWEMEFERLRRQFRYRRRDLARAHKLRPKGERWAADSALREFLTLFTITCLVPFGLTTVWLKLTSSPPLSMSEILITAGLEMSGTSILLHSLFTTLNHLNTHSSPPNSIALGSRNINHSALGIQQWRQPPHRRSTYCQDSIRTMDCFKHNTWPTANNRPQLPQGAIQMGMASKICLALQRM